MRKPLKGMMELYKTEQGERVYAVFDVDTMHIDHLVTVPDHGHGAHMAHESIAARFRIAHSDKAYKVLRILERRYEMLKKFETPETMSTAKGVKNAMNFINDSPTALEEVKRALEQTGVGE